jgi:diacylglycerol kinase family enzyme
LKICALIYNPIAGRQPGRREKEIRGAADVLQNAGLKVCLTPTTGPGTAQELARAAREKSDLVLVCGGDGTINEVINGLTPCQIPLGILPGGTANILGKELRLPHDPIRAAAELSRWTPRRIALGQAIWSTETPVAPVPQHTGPERATLTVRPCSPPLRLRPFPQVRDSLSEVEGSGVEGKGSATGSQAPSHRYFVSVAGIGFDAHIVYKLSTPLKMSWGVAGYILEAFRQLARYPFPHFICRMDERETRASFAVVQRTRLYAGWLHLAPTASLFEPRFSVCSFPSRSRARYLLYAAAVLMRRHLRLRDVELAEVREVSCAAADPSQVVRFELDGELVGALPATFQVIPDALTLLAP